jgi:hypothetical protein
MARGQLRLVGIQESSGKLGVEAAGIGVSFQRLDSRGEAAGQLRSFS